MISIREQSYGLNVALFNEFTVSDFRELEAAIEAVADKVHRPDLLLDLTLLRDFTLDMAWEQLKFVNEHKDDFGRIAVVTDDVWIRLGSILSDLLTRQHPKYFDNAAAAQEWLLQNMSED